MKYFEAQRALSIRVLGASVRQKAVSLILELVLSLNPEIYAMNDEQERHEFNGQDPHLPRLTLSATVSLHLAELRSLPRNHKRDLSTANSYQREAGMQDILLPSEGFLDAR